MMSGFADYAIKDNRRQVILGSLSVGDMFEHDRQVWVVITQSNVIKGLCRVHRVCKGESTSRQVGKEMKDTVEVVPVVMTSAEFRYT